VELATSEHVVSIGADAEAFAAEATVLIVTAADWVDGAV
jgi:hypothetical protein